MKCPKCLADVNDTDSVCSYCGSQLYGSSENSVVSNDVPVITNVISSDDVNTISGVDNVISTEVVSQNVVNTNIQSETNSDVINNNISNEVVGSDNSVITSDNSVSNDNKKSSKTKLFIIIGFVFVFVVVLIAIICLFKSFTSKSNSSNNLNKSNDSKMSVADRLDKTEIKVDDVLKYYDVLNPIPKQYKDYTFFDVNYIDYLENDTNDIKIKGSVINGTLSVGDELQLHRKGKDPIMLTVSSIEFDYPTDEPIKSITSDDLTAYVIVSNTDYKKEDFYGYKLLTTPNIINNHTRVRIALHNLNYEEAKSNYFDLIKKDEVIFKDDNGEIIYFFDRYQWGDYASFHLNQDELKPGEEIYNAELYFNEPNPIYVGAIFDVSNGHSTYMVGVVTKIIE